MVGGYDTHWSERFLGHPDQNPEAYQLSGLLRDAGNLRRTPSSVKSCPRGVNRGVDVVDAMAVRAAG
jgi:hypothetical protein